MQEERRHAERRIIAWEPQQCRSCGSMNGGTNRFCGMCGTALESERRQSDRRIATSNIARPASPKKVELPKPAPTSEAEPADGLDDANHAATTYLGAPPPSSPRPRGEWVRSSGSSFLGLEDEAPANSDYLFEEEQKTGGGWRVLIALLILAAVGYLIYKNWDSPTFAAALSQLHKRTQDSSATESKPQPPSAEQPSISTDENTSPPDAPKQAPPAAETKSDTTQPPATTGSASSEPAAKQKEESNTAKDSASATPGNDQTEENPIESTETKDNSSKGPDTPPESEKSASQKTPAPGQDLYDRGQAYLSGHGAPQSCDQGVVYTRAAAQQGNPKAAVQMGALYATGRCVSQDRVQAYNWFNEALRSDPNNEYVERSRSTLWAQMTSEERQRAAKE